MTDRLITLDASSVAIGYAIFRDGRLKGAGVVRSAAGTVQGRMRALLSRLMDELPGDLGIGDRAVLEWSEGRPMAQLKRMGRSAQSGIPMCHVQGALWQTLESKGVKVETVGDTVWTKRTPKEKRAAKVHMVYPDFTDVWAMDAGLDAADAVGIGLWVIDRDRIAAMVVGGKSLKVKGIKS